MTQSKANVIGGCRPLPTEATRGLLGRQVSNIEHPTGVMPKKKMKWNMEFLEPFHVYQSVAVPRLKLDGESILENMECLFLSLSLLYN